MLPSVRSQSPRCPTGDQDQTTGLECREEEEEEEVVVVGENMARNDWS